MDKSKRLFLQGAGAILAGISLYQTRLATAREPQASKVKYALLHDETLCIGCDACTLACREANQVPADVTRLTMVRSGPFGEYPNRRYHFSRQSCQQCENAPCVTVCPTGAAYIDAQTGIVKVDDWKCVGCQYCIAACPYKVRFIHPVTRAADKCDFCADSRLQHGQQPACVSACPTKALIFGDISNQLAPITRLIKHNAVDRDKVSLGTRPKLFKIRAPSGEVIL
ncbi:cytochrome c nitrite reductase Fe-S protein [Shewanella sp. NFH-SH190041]|uniref:4Fe-4S dicluster domain-containing protein n=1 Tax=Shewanella sp. NFH-SH190041 TaxID=2950245 RepID=UPI0021C31FBF|nr:4Fe-4S dicluster domain-containing protein [Shewanella sp. NFH-SH190041]BDM65963.1 cytochrome c nitrite reductase Fe-S protein [Shewanella sp. NFH-SH190041]